MKASILGTGMVGKAIAEKLLSLGHDIFMGTRNAGTAKPDLMEWLYGRPKVKLVSFEDLSANSDIFINATNGAGSIAALGAIGEDKLRRKIILDIANPLDFTKGMPPSLFISNTDSLGERIQKEFPESRVVKSLNTMNCYLMMDPSLVPGDHNVFMSGNHEDAKLKVKDFLLSLGWKASNMIDLGDITTARGTEMMLPIWLRLWGALGTAEFNFHVVRK